VSRVGFDLCRDAMAVEGVTAPEQSVLLTLAVMANDDRQCWPGIAGIIARTKLSERTVQRSLQGLKDAGHLSWVDKPGRGRVYVIHPRHSGTSNEATPATVTPRQSDTRQSGTPATVAPTPVRVAPKQPRTTISQKDKPSENMRARTPAFIPPDDIPSEPWADFADMRRRIGKPLSPKACELAVARLRKLAEDGWPPGDVLNHSTLNSYQGLFPLKDHQHGTHQRIAGHRGRPNDGFANALREASGYRGSGY
jgi:hypothetical protein